MDRVTTASVDRSCFIIIVFRILYLDQISQYIMVYMSAISTKI